MDSLFDQRIAVTTAHFILMMQQEVYKKRNAWSLPNAPINKRTEHFTQAEDMPMLQKRLREADTVHALKR